MAHTAAKLSTNHSLCCRLACFHYLVTKGSRVLEGKWNTGIKNCVRPPLSTHNAKGILPHQQIKICQTGLKNILFSEKIIIWKFCSTSVSSVLSSTVSNHENKHFSPKSSNIHVHVTWLFVYILYTSLKTECRWRTLALISFNSSKVKYSISNGWNTWNTIKTFRTEHIQKLSYK